MSPTLKTLWIGQPRGRVEDVAEEAERRVARGRGVDEVAGVLRDARGLDGVRVGGHDAAVGGDGGEVQGAAERDHQQPGDVAVGDQEGAEHEVRREVDLLAQPPGVAGEDRDDHDLDDERGHGERAAAELEVRERLQPAAQKGHRQDAQQQGGADQHTRDIDCSRASLEQDPSDAPRTYVQALSLGYRECR